MSCSRRSDRARVSSQLGRAGLGRRPTRQDASTRRALSARIAQPRAVFPEPPAGRSFKARRLSPSQQTPAARRDRARNHGFSRARSYIQAQTRRDLRDPRWANGPTDCPVAAAELLTVEAGGIVSSELSTTPRIDGPPHSSPQCERREMLAPRVRSADRSPTHGQVAARSRAS